MKQILAISLMFGALIASADSYLYWMVDQSAASSYTYNTVKVAQSNDGGESCTFLNLYYGDGTAVGGTAVSSETTKDYADAGLGLYAALGADAASYSYAIELFNDGDFVAKSGLRGQWFSYETLQDYIVSSSMATPASAWAPTPFAVPEPNSALLILVGCALLGLKRRKLRA